MLLFVQSFVDTPKEECLKCGSLISVTALRQHMISCNNGYAVLLCSQIIPNVL